MITSNILFLKEKSILINKWYMSRAIAWLFGAIFFLMHKTYFYFSSIIKRNFKKEHNHFRMSVFIYKKESIYQSDFKNYSSYNE